MGLGGVREREALADLDLDLAAGDDVEQLRRGGFEVGAVERVIVERRPGQEERALLRQKRRRKGSTGPDALPKLAIIPRRARQSSDFMKVSRPTPS